MKIFTNVVPKDLRDAVAIAHDARARGQSVAFAGGGSDLLGMMKDRLVSPDILIHIKGIGNKGKEKGLDAITPSGGSAVTGVTIGGMTTLDAIGRHPTIRGSYRVLAEAAETVATPQIRNVATLAGNICQRPWCWYYRNGFKCLKAGGTVCYSINGENEFHAIFGGGPSYIVHPSDTAPALVALDATFRIIGPAGERSVPASEFFTLPTDNPARENVLEDDEVLADVVLPRVSAGARSAYHKVMDREAWTHAIVSAAIALDIDHKDHKDHRDHSDHSDRTDQGVCRDARIVLGGVAPIPWRLREVEKMLVGQRITPSLAAKAGEAAVAGARPLAKNRYKVPMTQAIVRRAIESLARPA